MIISFKVISKTQNAESKKNMHFRKNSLEGILQGAPFPTDMLFHLFTSYSQHPPPLPVLVTANALHNPWGQSSFLSPLNPGLGPNSRACNHLHSFLSTFPQFCGCSPSPSGPPSPPHPPPGTLGLQIFPLLGSAPGFRPQHRGSKGKTFEVGEPGFEFWLYLFLSLPQSSASSIYVGSQCSQTPRTHQWIW